MKTLKYLLATMLLLGVCNLTHSQKLSLGIFPEPQEVTISSQTYTPPHGYTLRGINNPDADAVKLLKEALPFAKSGKSLPLEIKKLKDKTPEMQRSGAYTLTITKKGITIGIVDDNSLFYAAQTLKQLAKYDEGKKILPLCSIKDYPDVLFRGTVEGFYGQPWSHADRIEQIRFYGRIKLNTYIYGPKDDPYHSSPNWRKPYPAEEAEHIKELAKEASHNKVNFVWAIHPGQDIQWNLTDSMNILSKFEKMYDLGVRSFAVFFDDISGEGARPEKQAGLLNYIHKEFISKKNDVQPLIMCPTEYNRSWAKTDYLDIRYPTRPRYPNHVDRRPCRSRYHERRRRMGKQPYPSSRLYLVELPRKRLLPRSFVDGSRLRPRYASRRHHDRIRIQSYGICRGFQGRYIRRWNVHLEYQELRSYTGMERRLRLYYAGGLHGFPHFLRA